MARKLYSDADCLRIVRHVKRGLAVGADVTKASTCI